MKAMLVVGRQEDKDDQGDVEDTGGDSHLNRQRSHSVDRLQVTNNNNQKQKVRPRRRRKSHHSNHNRRSLASLVDWLQRPRVSTSWLRKVGIKSSSSLSDKNDSASVVPILTGLEAVLDGTMPASQSVTIVGIRPYPYLCYMLSGMICDIWQLLFDVFLHWGCGLQDPTMCWSIGFVVSIVPRHSALRYMVFGDYVGGYWKSLGRMYVGFSLSIVLSTIFNYIMTTKMGIPHYVAWIATLIWTGVVNYFVLKKMWSFGGGDKKDDE